MRKEIFQSEKLCLAAVLQPRRLQSGNKRKNRRKSKTPGALIYNVPGSRSGGIPFRAANSIGLTPHWGAQTFEFEKAADEISSTGGHRRLPHGLYKATCSISIIPDINNPGYLQGHPGLLCRSGGIRTRGLLVPNQTRYQTALHLDAGADEGTRTPDLLITNRLLYQLSHIGTTSNVYINRSFPVCPAKFLFFESPTFRASILPCRSPERIEFPLHKLI